MEPPFYQQIKLYEDLLSKFRESAFREIQRVNVEPPQSPDPRIHESFKS
jgi:hypothetical protein